MREKGLYSILIVFAFLIMGYSCTPQPAGPPWRQVTVHTITRYCLYYFDCSPAPIPLTTQELSYLLPNIFTGKSYGSWGNTVSSFPTEQLTYFVSPIAPLSPISAPTISSPLFLSFSGQTTSDPFISLPISQTNTGVIDYYSWLYFNEGTVAIDNPNGNIFYNGIRQVMMYKPDGTTVPVIGLPFSPSISNATLADPDAIAWLAQAGYPYTIPTTPVSTSEFFLSYTSYEASFFEPPNGPLFTPPYAFAAIFTIPLNPPTDTVLVGTPLTFTYTSLDMTSMDRTKVLLPPMVKLAVTNNDIIYFAIQNTIYQTSLQSNAITVTASLPISEEIVSMKVDNNSGLLYAASQHLENECSKGLTNCNPNIFTRPRTGYLWKIDPIHHIVTLLAGGTNSFGLTANSTPNQVILPIDIALDSTGRYLFFIDNLPRYNDFLDLIIQTGSFIEVLDLKQNKLYFVHGINVPRQKATFTNVYTSYMNLYFTSTATTATLYASVYGEDPDTPETPLGVTLPFLVNSSDDMDLRSIETISWRLP